MWSPKTPVPQVGQALHLVARGSEISDCQQSVSLGSRDHWFPVWTTACIQASVVIPKWLLIFTSTDLREGLSLLPGQDG